MMLRQQARDLNRAAGGSRDQLQHEQSSSQKKTSQNNNQQKQVKQSSQSSEARNSRAAAFASDDYVNTRPAGYARDTRHDIFYDEPEQNNAKTTPVDYTNVARSLDPTYREPDYQTIGPTARINNKGQVGMIATESPLSRVPPVAVPQNVKRSSKNKQDDKKNKSKKWF